MLAATLDTLEVEGWIARNPGHGHPLRPEYLLIASGRDAAAWCASTLEHLDTGALRRWSLPALQAISQGTDRFGDLAEKLAPITPRSLTMALENLADLKHVERSAEPSRHPRYRLTLRGKRLSGKLGLADNRRASC